MVRHAILRAAQALLMARGQANWPQVRRAVIAKANGLVDSSEKAMKDYQAREAKKQHRQWQAWCKRAEAKGGQWHTGGANKWPLESQMWLAILALIMGQPYQPSRWMK